jgi:hypothetical protein
MWGAGFTHALDQIDSGPRLAFLELTKQHHRYKDQLLGQIQLTPFGLHFVANMIAQSGVRSKYNPTPIRYDALADCLQKVSTSVPLTKTIVGPRFGAGLAGGDWSVISKLINQYLPKHTINIYDLP